MTQPGSSKPRSEPSATNPDAAPAQTPADQRSHGIGMNPGGQKGPDPHRNPGGQKGDGRPVDGQTPVGEQGRERGRSGGA